MTHATGYAIDHPAAIASQTSDKHWDMRLLLAGKPLRAIPADYWDPALPVNALDQDGVGACVAFAACTIKDAQEFRDWGQHLFTSGNQAPATGAFLAYQWLKQGHGTFPGDGIPNVEGSFPEAVWKLARMEGLPDKDGKVHKISAYYALSLQTPADFETMQQVILEYGSVNIGAAWPDNWFLWPDQTGGIMPPPGGASSGHSYTVAGWKTIGGVLHVACMNSWGWWGTRRGDFYFPASWLLGPPLGPQIAWKTVDIKDAPFPPPPEPGGPMLVRVDKTPRLVDSAVGKNLYGPDGVTVITPIQSGAANLNSPSSYGATAAGPVTHYSVEITWRGVPGLAWLKVGDCTNIRVVGTDQAALAAAEAKGAKAVKDAAIAEAVLHGG